MTKDELITDYANKVYALPTDDNWRENRIRLAKEHATNVEAITRAERKARTEDPFEKAEQQAKLAAASRRKQDESLLVNMTPEGERVRWHRI